MKLFWLSLCCVCLIGCTTYNDATGRREWIMLSTSEEVALGQAYHQEIQKKQKVITAGTEVDRLNAIGRKVASVSHRQDYTYRFYLIDANEMNAFTVPGGYIYVYKGLWDKLRSDDAVAGVLAHEIGHCAAKHVAKKFGAQRGYQTTKSIFIHAAQMILPQSGTAISLTGLGADVMMTITSLRYSRDDEIEADLLGLQYLKKAHYHPYGMVQVFDVLAKGDEKGKVPLILRSHPMTEDRRSKAVEWIKQNKNEAKDRL